MSAEAPAAASERLVKAWRVCEACGNWERSGPVCPVCGWLRTRPIPPGQARIGGALRFLIEVEVRSDRSWHVVAVRSARLPEVALDDGLLRALRQEGGPLRHLVSSNGEFPGVAAFERFSADSERVVEAVVNESVSRAWPAPTEPTGVTTVISTRCLVLDPEADVPAAAADWLCVVPFDTAAASAARNLDDSEVEVVSNRPIGVGDEGSLLSITVATPCELLVEGAAVVCTVGGEPRSLWRSEHVAAASRGLPLTLPTCRLPAEAVRGFAAPADPTSARVQVFVRGRKSPFSAPLHIAELPRSERVADLLLDLGSTTTKWALRFRDDGSIDEHDQDTESLVRAWGIPPYRKFELVADSTGDMWRDWLSRALPSLRQWVGREHAAFLGDVHVSLPTTKRFDVERLAVEIGAQQAGPLAVSAREHLVSAGKVRLAPEHAFLARHYLDVLRVLQDAAKTYAERFSSNEALRVAQASRRASWDAKDAELRRYKNKFFLARWFSTKPKGPSGSRPTISRSLTDPEAWMIDLIERPEQLDRVLLLDAGGLSLDVAALEGHRLVKELSHSFDACGGEALSTKLGRGQTGPRGTRHKAQLALRWRDAPNANDPQQREYIEATRALYEPVLRPLFTALGSRWRRSGESVVLLTGGGSRNPHLRDLVGELAAEAGLQPTVADAPYIQEVLQEARRFAEPLPELESASIRRFEETQAWSERRERQPWARYDKFAVVGGMLVHDGDGG